MRTVEDHQRVVTELIAPRPAQRLPLTGALGRVLAGDVVAPLALPRFDNSAMDGYAVHVGDVAAASANHPVRLPVAQDIPAGRTDALVLAAGTAHRIMTGAPTPSGATAVVPVEVTDGGTTTVTIRASAIPGQHVRRAGEDVTAGTTVLAAGRPLTPAALGLVAALGFGDVEVVPPQRVLVVSTGSELVAPGKALAPGQIYESNAAMLAAAVQDARAEVTTVAVTSDDVATFRAVLAEHGADADLIITTGGVSAGAYEVVKDSLADEVEFVKVAMQPGMPQGAGRHGGIAIVTLPGNPVSALVSFEVFVRAPLRSAMGLPDPHRRRVEATLTESLTSPRGKRQFRRGVLDRHRGTVTTYGPPASHHLRWLASANCLLELGEDVTELDAGADVRVWDLD